jgi:hypothetical protein
MVKIGITTGVGVVVVPDLGVPWPLIHESTNNAPFGLVHSRQYGCQRHEFVPTALWKRHAFLFNPLLILLSLAMFMIIRVFFSLHENVFF